MKVDCPPLKWTNWSAHLAWGVALTAVPMLKGCPEEKAVTLSIILGAAWELLYWFGVRLFGSESKKKSKQALPSFVDWVIWAIGAGIVVLVV